MEVYADIFVPFIVFSSIVATIALLLGYQLVKKRAFLRSVEVIAQNIKELSPEAIKELAKHYFPAHRDFRRGLLLILGALSLWAFSFIVDFRQNGNLDLNVALNGAALIPFAFGVGYMILHRFEK